MIIGKRQIILSALVLGLGAAVYLNWQYTRIETALPIAEILDWESGEPTTYGEAQYVDSPGMILDGEDAFFVEAQISRQRSRDQAAETLAVMLSEAQLTSDEREELTMRAVDLASSIETEGRIETLIRAKGFADVMVYYDSTRADVMVRTPGLLSNEANQIRDIIMRETQVIPQQITIVEVG